MVESCLVVISLNGHLFQNLCSDTPDMRKNPVYSTDQSIHFIFEAHTKDIACKIQNGVARVTHPST